MNLLKNPGEIPEGSPKYTSGGKEERRKKKVPGETLKQIPVESKGLFFEIKPGRIF